MTPYGRAIAMLTLYLEKRIDQDSPELEQLIDTIPLSELPETIWELLDIFKWTASILTTDENDVVHDAEVLATIQHLAADRQLWEETL